MIGTSSQIMKAMWPGSSHGRAPSPQVFRAIQPWPNLCRTSKLQTTLIVLLSLLTGGASTLAEEWEVHDIEARAERELGKSATIFGRFRSAGAGHLKLVDSNIDFVLGRGIRLRPGMEYVRLKGRLDKSDGRFVFAVEEIREVPGEREQFQMDRQRIRKGDYKSLYELSRWAEERAAWYDDDDLKRLAAKSHHEAFGWEEERLASLGDTEGLLAMAKRPGVKERDVVRIRHRALRLKAGDLPDSDRVARRRLAEEVQALLPGADVPLTEDESKLRADYLRDSLTIFNEADAVTRRTLARIFWTCLVAESLELQSLEETSDAGELARDARRLLPERPALARRLRLLDLTRQAAHPERLSRGKVLALRQALAQLDEGTQGQALVDAWLAAKRKRLPPDDAEQRWRLGRDFQELAGDEGQAARLYQEALQIAPGIAEAESGLRELGFERVGGTWQRTAQLEASQKAEIRRQRSGKLAPGDSIDDVYRRLGPPARIARTVTRNQITEQLIYAGPPALYVYTARKGSGDEAVVISIYSP